MVEEGFLIQARSLLPSSAEAFARLCTNHGVGPDLLLRVPKATTNEIQLDSQDRVQLGAAPFRDLVAAGL